MFLKITVSWRSRESATSLCFTSRGLNQSSGFLLADSASDAIALNSAVLEFDSAGYFQSAHL